MSHFVHRCSSHLVILLSSRHIHIPRYKHAAATETSEPTEETQTFSFNGFTWEDDYARMSNLNDKVAMRHMDMVMEQEENYLAAVMWDTEKLQAKLQSEVTPRLSFDLSTPPVKLGPWLYYRRGEEGKQYPVLCQRSVSRHEQFISNKDPLAGFDFTNGKRIEQKLVDYNQATESFGGVIGDIPNHQFFAYAMYDQEDYYFRLSVRNLLSGSLCSKPQADRVSGLAWVKGGKALLYVVTDHKKRQYRLYFSTMGSTEDDVLLLEELDENVCVNIRHAKGYHYVTVDTFSPEFSKILDPLTGLTHIWEGEGHCHCIAEHHKGFLYLFTDASKNGRRAENHYLLHSAVYSTSNPRLWEVIPFFVDEEKFAIEDVDFSEKYLALILRESGTLRNCSVALPLPVRQIPDAVVDYDLSNGTWKIVQQQNLLRERTRLLYGTYPDSIGKKFPSVSEVSAMDNPWNELSEFYSCKKYQFPSHDGVMIPLTIVYSRSHKKEDGNPGLLHGHGAYGEILDRRWRSELKSLLDRGWVIAFADVSCIITAKVDGKEAGSGVMADGRKNKTQLNIMYPLPDFLLTMGLFKKTNLRVPFLDLTYTLLYPILPLIAADYDEFGYSVDIDDFITIQEYSPCDNIPKVVSFPTVLVTSSFNTRFGVWEATKWVSRVCDRTIYDPDRLILLNLTADIIEENRYVCCKESALETAFLLKVVCS